MEFKCKGCSSCCCHSCQCNNGYFDNTIIRLNDIKDELKNVSPLWDDHKGFLSDGGCKLPTDFRSWVCLTDGFERCKSSKCWEPKYEPFAYMMRSIFDDMQSNSFNVISTYEEGTDKIDYVIRMIKETK